MPQLQSLWATSPPSLDGTLDPGEWADAATLDITAGVSPVILHVMNDAGTLYLALDCQADPALASLDYFAIAFDDEGGTPPVIGDGAWNAVTCPATEGLAIIGNLASIGYPADLLFIGQTQTDGCLQVAGAGMTGAYGVGTGHMVYEMALDLATSELHAQPGETMYAYFEGHDGNSFTVVGAFPAGADYRNPSSFAQLTLALPPQPELVSGWASAAPTVDGTLAPGEWADATTLDIGVGLGAAILHVMNDAGFLYLALDSQADPSLGLFDYFGISFEDEGGTPPLLGDATWNAAICPATEGVLAIGNLAAVGFPADDVFQGRSASAACDLESASGVSGAFGAGSGHMVYEMAIDLAASNLNGLPGETFRAYFECVSGDVGIVGAHPALIDQTNPALYRPLTLATPPLDVTPSAALPRTRLEAARPNPFGGSTELRFALREAGAVRIEVFNVLGRRVTSLVDGTMAAGEHFVRWDGLGAGGRPVADGLYYVRMRAGDFDQTRAMVRLR